MDDNINTPNNMENEDSIAEDKEKVTTEQPEGVQEAKEDETVSKDARMWGMFCHLAGLFGYIFPVVGNIVGTLVLWQLKKEDYPFVDAQGKEALNFQISMTIYAFVSALLMFLCVGVFLLAAVGIVDLVFLLIASVKANNGQYYRYPLTIRFIK